MITYTIERYIDSEGNFHTEDELDGEIDGGQMELREIELEVESDGQWCDEGIGSYEYWGCRGVDHDWRYEVDDIESAVDYEGRDWKDDLMDDEIESIIRECESNPPEPDCDEPDDYEPPYDDRWL